MAIAYVAANNAAGEALGSAASSTVSITPTIPAGLTNNQSRVFVYQVHNAASSAATPTDWRPVFKDTVIGSGAVASGSGQRRMSCYFRDKTAAWSAMPAFALTAATNLSHWIGVVALNKTATTNHWDSPTFSTAGTFFGAPGTAYTGATGSITTHSAGFVMVGAVTNDNVTSSSPTLTQTGATFASLTERCDGGTGTGNIVSGKVHTAGVTTGATAAVTHALTLSAASEGGHIVVEQTESAAKANINTLVDNYLIQDAAKWSYVGTAAATAGQAVVPCRSGWLDSLLSVAAYNLTDSQAVVQAVTVTNKGNGSTETIFELQISSTERYSMLYSNDFLVCREICDGNNSVNNFAWDASWKWWRMRESGGTIYYDTSPNGVDWTNRYNKPIRVAVTALQALLQAGYGGTEPSPGTAIFDNFNLPPTVKANKPITVAVGRASFY